MENKLNELNAELERMWNDVVQSDSQKYAPVLFNLPKPRGIVFVGLNPSFSDEGWKTNLKNTRHRDIDPRTFFSWPRALEFKADLAHELDRLAHSHYAFFEQHRKLSDHLNLHWEHIDLFAYRETNQSTAKDKFLKPSKDYQLNELGEKQYRLFEKMLELAKPRVVVVANALASHIYSQYRTPRFDNAKGCYTDKIGSNDVPVFFSGMLTGQRALDVFSRERLFWHIKMVAEAENCVS